jgi:cell division protease FtsH
MRIQKIVFSLFLLFFSTQIQAGVWKNLLRLGTGGLITFGTGYMGDQIKSDEFSWNTHYTIKNFPSLDQSRQKQESPETKVTFNDIAGMDSVVAEVQEVVDFLKNPQKYNALGAKFTKGILLVGPPGTGKTLLAKAISNESGCSFHYASASSFVELFVGQGSKRVRELFERANKAKPAIIFIDEIDAIGAINRSNTSGGGNDEYRQTLNELLCQMDGFRENSSVLIIGATNNDQALDKAIKRPGRFTRIIKINKPDKKAREEILLHYIKKLPKIDFTFSDVDNLADSTLGFSGAELENLVNEAAIFAVRENAEVVNKKHLEQALVKVKQRNI